MNKTHLFLISLLLIVCFCIPVLAYDIECSDEQQTDKDFTATTSASTNSAYIDGIWFWDVGERQGFKHLGFKSLPGNILIDASPPVVAYTTVDIYDSTNTTYYGSGIIGYTYMSDSGLYHLFLDISTDDIFQGLDGATLFILRYNASAIYNIRPNRASTTCATTAGRNDIQYYSSIGTYKCRAFQNAIYDTISWDEYDVIIGIDATENSPTEGSNEYAIDRNGWTADITLSGYIGLSPSFYSADNMIDEDALDYDKFSTIYYDIILPTSKVCMDNYIINETAPPTEELYATITAESGISFNTKQNVSFSFTTNIPSYDWVVWGFTNNDNYYLDKGQISFMKFEDIWYQYNESSFAYDIEVDAPYPYLIMQSWSKSTTTYKNQWGSEYSHEVNVRVSNQEEEYTASDTIQVIVLDSPDVVTIPIYVYSVSTGGLLHNWNARIWEFQPSNTTTYIYNKNSPYNHWFKYMGYYQIEINKTGYSNETYNYIITPDLNKIQIYLNKACGAPSGQGCINFYVMRSDDWNIKLSGVSIILNNQTKQTNSAGFVQFFVPVDIEYDYTAIKEPDYFSSSGSIEIDDEYEVLQELIYLVPKSIMPTTAPLPTITPTIAPTLTPEERESMGIVQFIIYYLSHALGTNTSETGLILGAGIVFLFLVVGGLAAGGMGAIGGMAAGFVISLALKVLPIWTFFAVIGLAFLGLIFFRNKDG